MRLGTSKKKYLPCLRCGSQMWTDAGNRLCRQCRRHNAEVYDLPTRSASSGGGEAGLWWA
jgi:NMD protein affecting ribosome stability and mRNA decay